MHFPVIVTFYAGLNGLIALVLAVLVVRLRVQTKTDLGSGGHPALERAIRAHGNFIEYVPLILLLLLLLELCETRRIVLHGLGAALTLGRILHAWGLHTTAGESAGRLAGITLTWATLAIAAVLAIVHGLAAL